MSQRSIGPNDLFEMVFVGDPQMSVAGDCVLFSKKTITRKNKYLSHLCSVDLEGKVKQWTYGDSSSGRGRWSPDGNWISFISGRVGDISQIFLIHTQGGEARKLTNFEEGSIGNFAWSPDGSKIAITFRPTQAEFTRAVVKDREEKGLSKAPLVCDDAMYRLDGDGYFGNQRYQLWVIDVRKALDSDGDPDHMVIVRYEEDVYGNYDFSWSPDSSELAVVHSASHRPFADPPNDQIWRLDCSGENLGKAWQLQGLPKGTKTSPRWSPDAKWIAYAGEVDEDDPWGVRNTRIYVVAAEGGVPADLTGDQDVDAAVATLSDTKEAGFGAALEWAPDASGLYVQIGSMGETQLGFAKREGGITILTEGQHALAIGNVGAEGKRIACVYGDATKLPEVATLERELVTGRWAPRILTDLNHEFHVAVGIVEPEALSIATTDGLTLHGWVLKPKDIEEGSGRPAVLQIHGGPHAQYGWAFFHELQCQVAAGYVVVYTNPRGSTGYGEAWTAAIKGDWGRKDWEDIQAAIGWMKEQPFIDSKRMAVMGGSYGGYMTNWAIGHCQDFKCAITDRCVSNMVSMAGNSDFPFNKNGYFRGIAWGDLNEIKPLWEQSPIAYFDKVKTPTLIIHSAGDLRCNIEQGEQVFTALQQEGVESRMVRYPESTSHGMSRMGPPDLRLHRLNEILSWLNKHLK
jgi:dipeptidyl aminopeptidase/acylaminoacyl peptidase